MAMALLQALARQSLPLTVKDEAVVEQLRWLRAANFITAVISPAHASQAFGTVLSITRRGREAIRLEQAATNGPSSSAAIGADRRPAGQASVAPDRRQAA